MIRKKKNNWKNNIKGKKQELRSCKNKNKLNNKKILSSKKTFK